MRRLDRHRLNVVQVAVVALEHQRVHRRPGAPDFRVLLDCRLDLRRRDRRHREGVGQRDRSLQHTEFIDLHQPDRLAEAVEDRRRRRHLVQEVRAVMHTNDRHPRLDRPLVQRAMADCHTGNIRDRITTAGGKHPDPGH